MKLHIRNMVCNRCNMAVQAQLEAFGWHVQAIALGEAEVEETLTDEEKEQLNTALLALGFELIDDRKSKLVERIKNILVTCAHYTDGPLKTTLSEHIAAQLHHDYSYLSKLFTEAEGTTIEQYFIAQRIERVKELLVYDEESLGQIADRLHYSSVSHLSKQFRKVTGLTPTSFRQQGKHNRKPLDEL